MMQIQSLLQGYKIPEYKKTRRTERGDFLDYFYEKINVYRKRDGFKELSMPSLAYLLSQFSIEDLYHLRIKCDTALEWSKCFNHYVFSKREVTARRLDGLQNCLT